MYPILAIPRKIIYYPDAAAIIRECGESQILKQINFSAADIFSLCDGKNSVEDIVFKLSYRYKEDVVLVQKFVEDFLNYSKKVGDVTYIDRKSEVEVKCLGSKKYWIPITVSLELTYKCPLFCEHCYRECSLKRKEVISLELVKKIAQEMSNLGILYLQITGGDPLYHPDFEKIIEIFVSKGIVITILTSGYYKNDSIFDFFEKVKGNIAGVQISIDGLKETHNEIRGKSNSYDKSILFIKKLVSMDYNIDVATTIIEQEKAEIFLLSEKLKKLGVKRHRLSILFDAGRSVQNGYSSNKNKKLIVEEWLQDLNNKLGDNKFLVQLEEDHHSMANSHCGAGYKLIRIDPSGQIHPCLMIDKPMSSLNNGTIECYSKEHSFKFKSVEMPSSNKCANCTLLNNCKGCIAEGLIQRKNVKECYWYESEKKS
ncbi:radical SAM protein [Enterococcus faecalis]|uniref:radical SAM protein n=2 Tax=Enterococcus faecalis TaxID=1351 RepID=UPI002AFE0E51|nr:radical SAM protein [Enterococcus faecalis]